MHFNKNVAASLKCGNTIYYSQSGMKNIQFKRHMCVRVYVFDDMGELLLSKTIKAISVPHEHLEMFLCVILQRQK